MAGGRGRRLSAAAYRSLKAATRLLVEANGGVDGAAAQSRVGRSQMARYFSAEAPDLMPVDVVADLENACGVAYVTAGLAHLSHGCYVPVAPFGETADWGVLGAEEELAHARLHAELIKDLGDFVSPGRVDSAEAPGLRDRLDKDLRALLGLRAHLTLVIEGGEDG